MAQDGDTVSVHYRGTLDSGEEFDSSRDREPLSFDVGSSMVIRGFDDAVRGLAVGDTVTVRMEPQDAYGERNDDLILEFPISELPEGMGEGNQVVFENGATGVILDITDDVFRIDANHRLAGEALTFEIDLVSIE